MTCNSCSEYRFCLERRGICRDYKPVKDLEEARKSIEGINKKYKSAGRAGTDAGSISQEQDRRLWEVHQGPSERIQPEAGTDPETETEASS